MSGPRVGSLCTGYGGLDMAVANIFGGQTVWVSDIDKGANKIIARRYPDVPNIGDMTTAAWAELEPVDILTAGYPCQPFSHAGNRKGTDDERHLWPHVREAVRVLRPRFTVLENVAGHRSLGFDQVLGDLAEDGLDVWWTSLRASDIGAAHRRERLFIFAANPNGQGRSVLGGFHPLGRDSDRRNREDGPGPARESTPLLPTPAVNDMGAAYTPKTWDAWTEKMRAEHGNGNGHGKSLAIEAQRLLPTPNAALGAGGQTSRSGARKDEQLLGGIVQDSDRWGDYTPAIARWETILGRPAPAPTQTSSKGNPQLAPAFVEWMMGLPPGWVADVPGITRNEALKALGNGVVPQQAEAAIRWLLEQIEVAA